MPVADCDYEEQRSDWEEIEASLVRRGNHNSPYIPTTNLPCPVFVNTSAQQIERLTITIIIINLIITLT